MSANRVEQIERELVEKLEKATKLGFDGYCTSGRVVTKASLARALSSESGESGNG